jgi:hypothetical protein
MYLARAILFFLTNDQEKEMNNQAEKSAHKQPNFRILDLSIIPSEMMHIPNLPHVAKISCLCMILFAVSIQSSTAQGFEEISSELGLDFGYVNGSYGGGVSFADFNQDGWDDLTYPTGDGDLIRFFLNTGSGFEEIEALVPNDTEVKQTVWVDYDNDGDLDLYTTSAYINRLYRNDGNLEFTDVTAGCGFTDDPFILSYCATWLDYDNDALPDLCVSFREAYLVGYVKLYHNIGNDQFQDVTASAGLSGLGNSILAMSSIDCNRDGWNDIYLAQDWEAGNILLKNNGNGTFTNTMLTSGTHLFNDSMSATIGDYDNDALLDIFVTNTEAASLLRNMGDGTFDDVAPELNVNDASFTFGAVFLDADNDMDLDIHMNSINGSIMYKQESGFVENSLTWGFDNYDFEVGVAVGDYNHDGQIDIAKNNSQGSLNTFFRNAITGNHYIAVQLDAQVSNSMAIGAIIDVYVGDTRQTSRIGCGEGFCSQNSYTQHFGLGQNLSVDSVVVYWPSGIVTHNYALASDQLVVIEELQPIFGCTNSVACNYNVQAVQDDGGCVFAELYRDCEGVCLADDDFDGVCNELEIAGCQIETACNYNPLSTDAGLCIYPEEFQDCEGNCLSDDDQDGVCDELEIAGCQDATACNYNTEATNAGQCNYPIAFFDCNGACLNDSDSDGVCDELEVIGCSDANACNYVQSATDEIPCEYAEAYYDCSGQCISDIDNDGVCDELEVIGCTDLLSCNYNASATDNGGCEYLTEGEITGATTANMGAEITFTFGSSTDNYFVWTVDLPNFILSGQGTNQVVIQFNDSGTFDVTVVESTPSGCVGETHSSSVIILNDVNELGFYDLKIFPSPANENCRLIIPSECVGGELNIYNEMGQKLRSVNIPKSEMTLDTQTLSSGIYIIQCKKNDRRFITRMVVKH